MTQFKSNYSFDLQTIYNATFGYVGAPFPVGATVNGIAKGVVDRFNPVDDVRAIRDQFKEKNALGIDTISPVELKYPDGRLADWKLPIEPIISIRSKNIFARRHVQEGTKRGSVKERWSKDDFSITLKGILINTTGEGKPKEDLRTLMNFIDNGVVGIQSTITDYFDITHFAIADYDFVSTPSNNSQAYVLKGFSDEKDYGLFIDV